MKNGLFAALALILALGFGALYRRQEALADRLDALERRPSTSPNPVPVQASAPVLEEPERARPPAEAPRPALAPPPAPAAGEAFSAAQREAIAREVERQMETRRPTFTSFSGPEDPLALMEKELNLSPAQKIRIAELWKRREEDRRKMFEGGAFKGGPAEHLKKVQELEEKYETAVNLELDFGQQQKYAQLKEEGRLQPGVVFRVQIGASEK